MWIKDIVGDLPKHKTLRYNTRLLDEITQIIVHHSATNSGTPEAFARYHVEENGWPGIGYHYVISKTGQIYKCQNVTTVSYHAGNANRRSIGVCLVGNFDTQTPTDVQMDALMELLAELITAYPAAKGNIIGHREVPRTYKSCPGKNVDMNKVRDCVASSWHYRSMPP